MHLCISTKLIYVKGRFCLEFRGQTRSQTNQFLERNTTVETLSEFKMTFDLWLSVRLKEGDSWSEPGCETASCVACDSCEYGLRLSCHGLPTADTPSFHTLLAASALAVVQVTMLVRRSY